MTLEELLAPEDLELVNMMLYYSEVPSEKYPLFLGKITDRIEQHLELKGGLNQRELYELVRGAINRISRRKDRIKFALPLIDSNFKIGSLHPAAEDDLLVRDRKPIYLLKIEETLDFLRKKLTLNEYNYLMRMLNQDPLFFSRRMPFTVEQVSQSLDSIRTQISLELRAAPPDGLVMNQIYAMSMEKVLTPYVLATYKKVLQGQMKTLPKGFLSEGGSRKVRIATRYLLEDLLKMEFEKIPGLVSTNTFKEHHLWGALASVYRGSVVEAVTDAYKGSFRPWEFNRVPFDYWQGEEGKKHAIEAVKWLVVEKLNLTKLAEVPSKLNKHVFNKYGLDGMLNIFNHSTYRAVDAAYPGRFKPWEFERVPINYWCGPDGKKHAEEAMKWLIEEKLKISVREIPGKVTSSCLKKYRLGSMLKFCYDDQIYNAIDSLYPGKFKLWEIKKVENRFWEGENGEAKVKEAMEWLLIEWFHSYPRPEDLPHKFTEKLFSKSRLRSLLQTRFHGSVQEAVDYAWKEFYPAYMMS